MVWKRLMVDSGSKVYHFNCGLSNRLTQIVFEKQ